MDAIWDVVVGLILAWLVYKGCEWKAKSNISRGIYSPRTPLWSGYGLPDLVNWTKGDWDNWSSKTGVTQEMWNNDTIRNWLILGRRNPF